MLQSKLLILVSRDTFCVKVNTTAVRITTCFPSEVHRQKLSKVRDFLQKVMCGRLVRCIKNILILGKNSEIFIGVLMYEICTNGKCPYDHLNNYAVLDYVKRGGILKKPDNVSAPIYEVHFF